VEQYVDHVQQVTQVVQAEPHHNRVTCGPTNRYQRPRMIITMVTCYHA
jgi:hypothetical protein